MTDKQAEGDTGAATTDEVVTEGFVAASQEDGITRVVAAAADSDGNAIFEGVVADEQGILAEGAIGVSGDNAIVVARFANMDAAQAAYATLVDAEKSGALDIDGVLVANADAEGKINVVKMTDHHTRKGFLAGAVAGVVLGIIFPPSIIASALAVGAGGAAIGKLGNLNAKNDAARDLASVLTPGSSGIIALVRLAQVEEVKKELPEAAEVKAAPVSDEAAAAVKDAAAAAGSVPA
jgi:uncharacterized membrane protein